MQIESYLMILGSLSAMERVIHVLHLPNQSEALIRSNLPLNVSASKDLNKVVICSAIIPT